MPDLSLPGLPHPLAIPPLVCCALSFLVAAQVPLGVRSLLQLSNEKIEKVMEEGAQVPVEERLHIEALRLLMENAKLRKTLNEVCALPEHCGLRVWGLKFRGSGCRGWCVRERHAALVSGTRWGIAGNEGREAPAGQAGACVGRGPQRAGT
jgi:hypothetical protein